MCKSTALMRRTHWYAYIHVIVMIGATGTLYAHTYYALYARTHEHCCHMYELC